MKPLNLTGYFFKNYKEANPNFSEETFKCAEETVGDLLHHQTTSDHPGMLLGKVQSGKTRTFISIMALAFDNSFDVAVVLSKNSTALLEQTINRLNSEFEAFIEDEELTIYDIMHAPDTFRAWELDNRLVFVAKKQRDNLSRLIRLFSKSCPELASKRVLFIDDEADNASIGYVRKKDVLEARTIATQISELRGHIEKASFLQVTATPYSLYLQPSEVEVANTFDFKPVRPAFTRLVPIPNDYVGGDVFFHVHHPDDPPTVKSCIHCDVDPAEFDRLRAPDRRSFRLEDVLDSNALTGYRTAVIRFIMGGCLQRHRLERAGEKPSRLKFSFLLHSEAAKNSHQWQLRVTEEIRDQLHRRIASSCPRVLELLKEAYEDMKLSMKLDDLSVPSFEEAFALVLEAFAGDQISIFAVNSDQDVQSLLDNRTGQLRLRTPFNIFIGGQVLDRGVTISNLIGFYYGRRPQTFQQDTVLQHSRMFGYRRPHLAVTRFYTSPAIRAVMRQMEEFDTSLRNVIESGRGDQAVQFIRRAADGSIVPCSPNKILVANTQTLRPGRRLLPIGFQSGYRTGQNGIGQIIGEIDAMVENLCGFNAAVPVEVPLDTVRTILRKIESTLFFEDKNVDRFDWKGAEAVLNHLSQQHPDPAQRGKVLLWAASGRQSSRLAGEASHATFIETPDSDKTEGEMARRHAIEHPIVFLLRQEGQSSKGWRDTPFYWPVIRAQENTPTAVYTSETL